MTATPHDDLYSRSRLAGYDEHTLANAHVLVVGCGAVGQNLVLDLALSGVGAIAVVDHDTFEAHNATRSPFYPSATELAVLGPNKATVVAHRLSALMTTAEPEVRHRVATIQQVGDAAIAWADVVCSAVDNPRARAYLAERCRYLGVALVEVGFEGSALNLGVFGPDPADACYRCLNPQLEGAFSCAAYASQAEANRTIPALQTGAAALAALQAEQVIRYLHGHEVLQRRRAFFDVATLASRVVHVERAAACPGIHHLASDLATLEVEVTSDDTLAALFARLGSNVGRPKVRLAGPIVVDAACARCGRMVAVRAAEWEWLRLPCCAACGGPWTAWSGQRVPLGADWIDTDLVSTIGDATLEQLGAPPGSLIDVLNGNGQMYIVQVAGGIDDVLPRLEPGPLASAGADLLRLVASLANGNQHPTR